MQISDCFGNEMLRQEKIESNDFLAFLKRKRSISTRGNSRITERAPIPTAETRRAPGQPEPRTLHADVHEGGQRADDGGQQGQQHQQVAVQQRSSRAAEPPLVHGVQRQDADPPAGSGQRTWAGERHGPAAPTCAETEPRRSAMREKRTAAARRAQQARSAELPLTQSRRRTAAP